MTAFSKFKNLCLVFLIAGLDFLGGPLLLYYLRSRGIRTYSVSQFFQYPAQVLQQNLLISVCVILVLFSFLLVLRKKFWKAMGLKIENDLQLFSMGAAVFLLVMAAAFGIRRTGNPREIFFNLFYYVVFIGFTEEFIFRGACSWLLRYFPWQIRYLLPNFLFATIHILAFSRFEPVTLPILLQFLKVQMPGLMASGCCLQLTKDYTGTLWVPVLLHGLMDFSILFL